MNAEQIRDDLVNFLAKTFVVEPNDIDLNKSLVDEGIIDSLGLIEISSYIEKKYGLSIEPKEMNRENFGSVMRIAGFIAHKSTSRQN